MRESLCVKAREFMRNLVHLSARVYAWITLKINRVNNMLIETSKGCVVYSIVVSNLHCLCSI